ncbi:MAG: carbonic anhydrase [Solirubrobacteraceae bacterium]
MSVTDELVRSAKDYTAAFDQGDLPMPPGRKVAVVACMDARLNPFGLLGLREGDAHVIRNAGGVIGEDAIRSLAISQRLLGTEIVLIHHTDCGMLPFTDDEFKRSIRGGHRHPAAWAAEAFPDPRPGRPPVDRAGQGLAVHPAPRQRARVRLRRPHKR